MRGVGESSLERRLADLLAEKYSPPCELSHRLLSSSREITNVSYQVGIL